MNNKNINKLLVIIIILLIVMLAFLFFKLYKVNKFIENEETIKSTYHTAVLIWKANNQDNNMQKCVEIFTYDNENVITHRTIMTFLNEELAKNHYDGLDKKYYSAEIDSNTINITDNIEKNTFKKEVIFSTISEYENTKDQNSGEFTYEIY